MKEKILVLGGTGAMGTYVVPALADSGYKVDVVAFDEPSYDCENVGFVKGDGKDIKTLTEILKNGYEGIIDFLTYTTAEFEERYRLLLENTRHYIFLSSYRVYDGIDTVINENSPRLISTVKDPDFIGSDDYAITKCRQENILENSKYMNWTIVRPSIVYSKRRFQLIALEANMFLPRVFRNQKIILPECAMEIQSTMTWAGDIAKIMARLILNPKTMREKYTISTAEHNPWRYVLNCYEELIGLEAELVDYDTYVNVRSTAEGIKKPVMWQLDYDRLLNRVVDNSKVLAVTGLKQSDFVSLKDGLKRELANLPRDYPWDEAKGISKRMDDYLNGKLI